MAKKAKSAEPTKAATPAPANAGSSAARRYHVLSPYSYHYRGEKKTGWTEVGSAFPSKDGKGFNLEIRPGLSVQGRLVLRPWEPKNDAAGQAEPDSAPQGFFYDPNSSTEDFI